MRLDQRIAAQSSERLEVARRARVGSDDPQSFTAFHPVQRALSLEQRHWAIEPLHIQFCVNSVHAAKEYPIVRGSFFETNHAQRSICLLSFNALQPHPSRYSCVAMLVRPPPLPVPLSKFAILAFAVATASVLQAIEPGKEVRLPELGDPASAIVSLEEERALGQQLLKQIRAQMPLSSDPLIKYFVRLNLLELATSSELAQVELNPIVVASPELNAFAAPGGIVGANLGLFKHAEDVHEYSSVMAHELAHLSQRHYARTQEASHGIAIPTLVSLLGSIAILAKGNTELGQATMMGSQAMGQQAMLRYSRTFEAEADRIGFNTLVRAGFDPLGMERMFKRMNQLHQGAAAAQWLLTHPLTESRMGDARRQADQVEIETYSESIDYQMARVRAILAFARTQDEIMDRAAQVDTTEFAQSYAAALAHLRTQRWDESLQLFERLRALEPTSLLLAVSYGEALVEAEQPEAAVSFLKDQLEFNPGNPPLAMTYAKALRKAGDPAEAVRVLRRQSRARPNDIDLWHELSETAGLSGEVLLIHQSRAEFYALRGDNEKALEHLEIASDLVEPDSRQGAMIKQRILQLVE